MKIKFEAISFFFLKETVKFAFQKHLRNATRGVKFKENIQDQ